MKKFISSLSLLILLCNQAHSYQAEENKIPITPWKDLRDYWVVKQEYDYSCGASSLATILNYYYNMDITEQKILFDMNLNKNIASFADLSQVAIRYNFKPIAIRTSFDGLKNLKIPVIVYIQYQREEHFSVLKSIDNRYVYLADSKWGNVKIQHKKFKEMWHTPIDDGASGRILAIAPTNNSQIAVINNNFLTRR